MIHIVSNNSQKPLDDAYICIQVMHVQNSTHPTILHWARGKLDGSETVPVIVHLPKLNPAVHEQANIVS